jgi:hypothetical protein
LYPFQLIQNLILGARFCRLSGISRFKQSGTGKFFFFFRLANLISCLIEKGFQPKISDQFFKK